MVWNVQFWNGINLWYWSLEKNKDKHAKYMNVSWEVCLTIPMDLLEYSRNLKKNVLYKVVW